MLEQIRTALRREEGIALYLSLIIMGLALALSVGIATSLLREIGVARNIARYTPALAAADTGIERALYEIRKNGNFTSCPTISSCAIGSEGSPIQTEEGGSYYVIILDTGVDWCTDAPQRCIRSLGGYQGTNRALEASF